MEDIIPIGKYKGKPIDILAKDKDYTDWLLAQSWFKQKYPQFYTIIINNFQECSETPEHNKIQIKFLDDNYCLKLVYILLNNEFPEYSIDKFNSILDKLILNFISENSQYYNHKLDQNKINVRLSLEKDCWKDITYHHLNITNKRFEEDGIDVSYSFFHGFDYSYSNCLYVTFPRYETALYRAVSTRINVLIEIKPSLSDDFPKVLRQVKNSRANVLIISEYTGIGATKEQVINLFHGERVKLIFEKEIDQCKLPDIQ